MPILGIIPGCRTIPTTADISQTVNEHIENTSITKALDRIFALRFEHQNELSDIFYIYSSGCIEALKANVIYEESVKLM